MFNPKDFACVSFDPLLWPVFAASMIPGPPPVITSMPLWPSVSASLCTLL